MKVLIAMDHSPQSHKTLLNIAARSWPRDVQLKIVNVIEPARHENCSSEWLELLNANHERRKQKSNTLCKEARTLLLQSIPDCHAHYEVREGDPREQLLETAAEWGADKIIMSAHSNKTKSSHASPAMLGSVSRTVAGHANCSVEIVRSRCKETA